MKITRDSIGRKIKLPTYNGITIVYSTTDFTNLKCILIDYNSWVIPYEVVDYDKVIKQSEKKIRQLIFNLNNDEFKKDSIVFLNVRKSGLTIGERSYFGLEVYIYTNYHMDFKSIDLRMTITNISKKIIDECLTDTSLFNFSPKPSKIKH